jgi:putative PIN family toxin of toxin-antitoxin system
VRVVLDSSVLIAASISRAGICAELFEDVITHHELVLSDFIAEELTRKLRDKFSFPGAEIRDLRRFLQSAATFVIPTPLSADACRDPTDIAVLGTALAGNASLLVTVDKDLLVLKTFQGITIIRPGEFWRNSEV